MYFLIAVLRQISKIILVRKKKIKLEIKSSLNYKMY